MKADNCNGNCIVGILAERLNRPAVGFAVTAVERIGDQSLSAISAQRAIQPHWRRNVNQEHVQFFMSFMLIHVAHANAV